MSPDPQHKPEEPQPHLTPTKISTLLTVVAVTGLLAWTFARTYYGDFPALPWFGSVALLVLAVVEFFSGQAVKARITRKPGKEPIEPLLVARLAALAKASSLVGAATAGVFGGIGVWVLAHAGTVSAAARDVPMAGLGVLAGIALTAGALWLEASCRIPSASGDASAGPDSA